MSDWGAVPEWEYALRGLDQESGIQMDVKQWGSEAFTDRLRTAYVEGKVPKARLSDMVRRILRSMYAVGIDRRGQAPPVDMAKHHEIALEIARQGIVLLKNDGLLPLAADTPLRIAVIGGHAHQGVISGTGSGAVLPVGGFAGQFNVGGPGTMGAARSLFLFAPSPLAELKKAFPRATVEFDPGYTPAEAALMARRSDLVIAFGIRVEGEGFDIVDLSLPWGQDAVIDAVAAANANTLVVLETGNPVSMPWRSKVKAILQAWYPG
jgi:beta-glucosidase